MTNGNEPNTSNAVLTYMLKELSSMTYGYKNIVEGCYDDAIRHGLAVPPEGKDAVVNRAIAILNGAP